MNKLLSIITLCGALLSSNAFAHGEGHGKVDQNKVIQAAQTFAKKLTFKDLGMSVGKLDTSWSKVDKSRFKFLEEAKDVYLVRATNNENAQTLYFVLSKEGKILSVKDAEIFEHDHGHKH